MDIGEIAIHLTHGVPTVSRCEEASDGMRFVAALNAAELVDEARSALEGQGTDLDTDGLYLCPEELIAVAQFPPLLVPGDAILFGTARILLYPDVSANTAWQRVRSDAKAGRLRVYQVGQGNDVTRYVSRTEVMQLRETQRAAA